MNSVRFVRKALMVAIVFAAASNVVFAQEAGAAAAPVLHYFGAALGLGMIVIGAALGIGKFAVRRRGGHRAPAGGGRADYGRRQPAALPARRRRDSCGSVRAADRADEVAGLKASTTYVVTACVLTRVV